MDAAIGVRSVLATVPLFRELGEEEIDRIAARTRQVRAQRGEILLHRGEEANGLHVVVSGMVKLAFLSSRGDENVVDSRRSRW